MTAFFTSIGAAVRNFVGGVGHATRMFFALLALSPALLRRPRLVTDQVFFVGNLSLVIIAVSGLFVGFVLGLQGYYPHAEPLWLGAGARAAGGAVAGA